MTHLPTWPWRLLGLLALLVLARLAAPAPGPAVPQPLQVASGGQSAPSAGVPPASR